MWARGAHCLCDVEKWRVHLLLAIHRLWNVYAAPAAAAAASNKRYLCSLFACVFLSQPVSSFNALGQFGCKSLFSTVHTHILGCVIYGFLAFQKHLSSYIESNHLLNCDTHRESEQMGERERQRESGNEHNENSTNYMHAHRIYMYVARKTKLCAFAKRNLTPSKWMSERTNEWANSRPKINKTNGCFVVLLSTLRAYRPFKLVWSN